MAFTLVFFFPVNTGFLGSLHSAATNAYQMYNAFSSYPSFSTIPPQVGGYPGYPASSPYMASFNNFLPTLPYVKAAPYPGVVTPGHVAYHPYDLHHQTVRKSVLYSVLLSELLRRVAPS